MHCVLHSIFDSPTNSFWTGMCRCFFVFTGKPVVLVFLHCSIELSAAATYSSMNIVQQLDWIFGFMQRDETADLTIFNVNFQQGRMIELFIVCIDRSINIDVQYLHVKYYLIKLLMHKFTVLGSIFYHPLRSIIFNNIERACITPSGVPKNIWTREMV